MAPKRPRPAAVKYSVEVEFSDGTAMEFTHEQYAELVAKCLVSRCPDCPRFASANPMPGWKPA